MGDYSWIAPVAKGAASLIGGQQAQGELQGAYQQMLENLKQRYAEYDALGNAGYKDIQAQQVGPSALEGIPQDLQARQQQQESIAALQDLADRGGLSLSDMKALNDIQANLSRNNSARQQGLANQYAARGQLGSGAQLSMDLANQQNAATNANDAGESAAAQAQARAFQAILEKGKTARSMSNDDYARKSEAARAHDMIEARNAAARTDASKYNNQLAGQNYEDQLRKIQGKTGLTESTNKTLYGSGQAKANNTLGTAGIVGDMFGSASKWGSMSGGGGGSGGGTDGVDNGDGGEDESVESGDD
jgi:hypothetical protein